MTELAGSTSRPEDNQRALSVCRRWALPMWGLTVFVAANAGHAAGPHEATPPGVYTSSVADATPRAATATLENCAVFAIDSIQLPAQETGLIRELPHAAGGEVRSGELVAAVDDAAVKMEEAIALLQSQVAAELAADPTDELFAEAVLKEAELGLESYREIQRRGSATDAELRGKQLAVEQAKLKLQHARHGRRSLEAESKLAQRRLEAVRQRLDRFRISAPFDGVLATIDRRPGEWVQAGQPLATLTRLSELRVDAYVLIADLPPAAYVGRSVWVELPQSSGERQPTRLGGRVTHYDPEATAAGTVRLHATVQNVRRNGQWLLLPGMLVRMQVLPAE